MRASGANWQTTERTQKIYGAMKKDMKFQYDTRVQRDADIYIYNNTESIHHQHHVNLYIYNNNKKAEITPPKNNMNYRNIIIITICAYLYAGPAFEVTTILKEKLH